MRLLCSLYVITNSIQFQRYGNGIPAERDTQARKEKMGHGNRNHFTIANALQDIMTLSIHCTTKPCLDVCYYQAPITHYPLPITHCDTIAAQAMKLSMSEPHPHLFLPPKHLALLPPGQPNPPQCRL
jgi:hypothetical protein